MEMLVTAARAGSTTVRLLLLAILSLLEPVVTWLASAMIIVALVMTAFFTLIAKSPHFPLGVAATLIAGPLVGLALYYGLLRWLSDEA